MDPITLAAKTSSTDLFASAIPLMACVSPLSASSTRSKRSRENDADNDSLCEHESPTKKPTYQDDASSQRSITPLAFDHLEPTDDIRVQQHFTLPAPPCPSPADLETLSHSTQELLVQIAQLNTVKERLVRERELDREKFNLQVSLLEAELEAMRTTRPFNDENPASQVTTNTPFKRTLTTASMTRPARIALLNQQIQANNAYIQTLLRSPAFSSFTKSPFAAPLNTTTLPTLSTGHRH